MNPMAQGHAGDMGKGWQPADSRFAEEAVRRVLDRIDGHLRAFRDACPEPSGVGPADDTGWKTSCRTGILWLAYELTGNSKYRKTAEIQLDILKERAFRRIAADTPYLGFIYTLSCVAAYKLAGNQEAKRTAVAAADLLMERYFGNAGGDEAWRHLKDPAEQARMVIDCCANLPLLFWAARATGNPVYDWLAARQAEQCAVFLRRKGTSADDAFHMDDEGRAMAIYGVSLSYRYTDNPELLQLTRDLAIHFLNKRRAGHIEGGRGGSAAAVAICGMLELSGHLHAAGRAGALFEKASLHMLKSLAEHDRANQDSGPNGIFEETDEFGSWGGYYYFEGLVRALNNWSPYW